MVQYRCNKCSTVKQFSIGGFRIECKCGGWLESVESHNHKNKYDYVECICPKCKKVSMRPKEHIGKAECHCCGTKLESNYKQQEQVFEYICATCGHIWSKSDDKTKVCPECGSLHIVIKYDDINKELYDEILYNYNHYQRYLYKCSCGHHKYLYSNNLHNIVCNKCYQLMQHIPTDILVELKRVRKLHRMSQADLAKRFKISQQFYSKIERGLEEIPAYLLPKIVNFTTNPY